MSVRSVRVISANNIVPMYMLTRRRDMQHPDRDAYGPFTWEEVKAARRRHAAFVPRIHLIREERLNDPTEAEAKCDHCKGNADQHVLKVAPLEVFCQDGFQIFPPRKA